MVLRSQSRMRPAKNRACDRICTSKSRGRGGIGIRSGLKIRRRKACGFESHRSYQGRAWLPGGFRPMAASRRKGLEPMRWNSVKKTCQWHVFRNSPDRACEGGVRVREAGARIPPPPPRNYEPSQSRGLFLCSPPQSEYGGLHCDNRLSKAKERPYGRSYC